MLKNNHFIVLAIMFIVNKIKEYIKHLSKQAEERRLLYEKQTYEELKLFTSVTQFDRGTKSERELVARLLREWIPPITIYHDLYIKRYNGNFTQIDLVVITKVGILVFEVKEYNGWIFGRGNDPQWTQVLNYGNNKYRFYNPILQNNKHIEILKSELKRFGEIPFFSIIVFYGDCELRNINFVPQGTFIVKSHRVMDVINSITTTYPNANYTDKKGLICALKQYVSNGSDKNIQKEHIENIRDMLGNDRIFN